MNQVIEHIHRRLHEEGERVIAFFETLPRDQLEVIIYDEGPRWNARQVLCHLVASENAYQHHLEQLLKSANPLIFDQNIDEFNQAEVRKINQLPVGELLDSYRKARQRTLLLVEDMKSEDLAKTAIHPWFGEQEVVWLLKLIYRHNAMHLQDIRRNLKNTTAASPTTDSGLSSL